HLIDLKPKHEWRKRFHEDKDRLIASMRSDLEQITGVDYYFTQYIQTTLDEALSGVQGSLVAKIVGPDLVELENLGNRVGRIMRSTGGIVDVIVDPLIGQPQLMIEIDRAQAARYGLSVEDIKDLTEIAIGGRSATTVIEGERRFDVVLRFDSPFRTDKYAFKDLLIDTPSGARVPLSQFARVRQLIGATQIWRESGSRMATIRANVRGRDLASSVAEAQTRVEKEIDLPPGYQVIWSGEFQRQSEAIRQLSIVIPVTLFVILTVLYLSSGGAKGALVMFSVVPMACIGAVFSLYLTNTYFSISAGVGFICLFGLAVKNSILLLSFVNELRVEGAPIHKAVYEGALIRLRPVLMTATIAAAGLLPAALSNEIGAQTQRPFAIVIIGGLVTSTALTLFVLPALYQWLAPRPKQRNPKEISKPAIEAVQ
ncbi:MAG: efflux RND transporter permease subunit, partial [Cyanobacteria bacterium]|nr:efflux RND transporter permease subunit [Cyanobacteriota bacterium]